MEPLLDPTAEIARLKEAWDSSYKQAMANGQKISEIADSLAKVNQRVDEWRDYALKLREEIELAYEKINTRGHILAALALPQPEETK